MLASHSTLQQRLSMEHRSIQKKLAAIPAIQPEKHGNDAGASRNNVPAAGIDGEERQTAQHRHALLYKLLFTEAFSHLMEHIGNAGESRIETKISGSFQANKFQD